MCRGVDNATPEVECRHIFIDSAHKQLRHQPPAQIVFRAKIIKYIGCNRQKAQVTQNRSLLPQLAHRTIPSIGLSDHGIEITLALNSRTIRLACQLLSAPTLNIVQREAIRFKDPIDHKVNITNSPSLSLMRGHDSQWKLAVFNLLDGRQARFPGNSKRKPRWRINIRNRSQTRYRPPLEVSDST